MMNFADSIQVAHSDSEREKIYEFRYRIYIEEMGKPYAHADHERKILTDELDDGAMLLYATRNREVIGTVRINWGISHYALDFFRQMFDLEKFSAFPSPTLSFCSRLMVERSARSSSLAARLSTAAFVAGRERGIQFNFIHCVPQLAPLFQRMGFRHYKDSFHDPEVGTQIPLVLLLDDLDHLKRVRSPFVPYAEQTRYLDPVTWFQSSFDSQPMAQ
jgi:predicted GNAT family N-acyltransferase